MLVVMVPRGLSKYAVRRVLERETAKKSVEAEHQRKHARICSMTYRWHPQSTQATPRRRGGTA